VYLCVILVSWKVSFQPFVSILFFICVFVSYSFFSFIHPFFIIFFISFILFYFFRFIFLFSFLIWSCYLTVCASVHESPRLYAIKYVLLRHIPRRQDVTYCSHFFWQLIRFWMIYELMCWDNNEPPIYNSYQYQAVAYLLFLFFFCFVKFLVFHLYFLVFYTFGIESYSNQYQFLSHLCTWYHWWISGCGNSYMRCLYVSLLTTNKN
jgi:hypothetical protein